MLEIQTSPDIQIDTLKIPRGRLFVVRDDLLQGGTKQRAALPFVRRQQKTGVREFVYASPFAGFAQVALASACAVVGVDCTLFCERDRSREDGAFVPHDFSKLAASFGARLVICESLEEATRLTALHTCSRPSSSVIPLGFDCAEFREDLTREVSRQWSLVQRLTGRGSGTLWLPVGSGTLASVFRRVIEPERQIKAIDVRVLGSDDPRLRRVAELKGVLLHSAPQPFVERSRTLPPIASNVHYDAKLWEFILRDADDGDIWWNVAR